MEKFFNPTSIAVVGASENTNKLGNVVLRNILRGGFKGKVYPVNPKSREILGLEVYKKVSLIKAKVDIVCIVVPSEHVLEIVKDCTKKKVKGLVIISAGFSEIGPEGKLLEQKIQIIAKKHNIRILGPNCLGFINKQDSLNLSFAADKPFKGNVGFFSQSGAFCTAMLDMSIPKNLGFSHFVSIGNKADINELDLVEYFLENKKVKVISAYLEDIVDGSLLIQNYEQSEYKKPFVILKAGQTEESKSAIESHTGAIAGSIDMFRTGTEQVGIIEASNTRQLFNYTMMFSWSKPMRGDKIAIVTNAGGPGIVATDSVIKAGLKMADLSKSIQKKIQKFLPSESSSKNPVDIIGDANAQRYQFPIDILAKNDEVDAILVLLTPQLVTQVEETAKIILNASQMYEKPIIPVFLGKKQTSVGTQIFYDNYIPIFTEIDDAVQSLKVLSDYYTKLNQYSKKEINTKWKKIETKEKGKYTKEIQRFVKKTPRILPDEISEKLAKEVGFTLPKQIITKKLNHALEFAKNNYPVVLKIANEVIVHKTDMKAIYLNIQNSEEFEKAYKELSKNVLKKLKLKTFNIVLQEQLSPRVEFFIGANRDGDCDVYKPDIPGFGHLIVFGKGGIYTEIFEDFAYVLVPTSKDDIKRNLEKTKVYKILEGARGQKSLNVKKIIEQIYKVQKLTLLYPEIISLDINPLIITQDDAITVDIKVFVGK